MALLCSSQVPAKFLVYGASGMCLTVAHDARYQAEGAAEHVGYVDDERNGYRVSGEDLMVYSFDEAMELAADGNTGVLVPFHDAVGRRQAFESLAVAGVPIIGLSGSARNVYPFTQFGDGVVIASHSHVAAQTKIGRGVIFLGDSVGHDVNIGEFAFLAPGSIVSGHVEIGDGVFVGAGAVIANGRAGRPLHIGAGALIGAGAVIDRDVLPGATMAGPRAGRFGRT